MDINVNLGDIYELKKPHPCGINKWKVTRVGIDCKIQCLGCGHIVMVDRVALKKSIKKVIEKGPSLP